MFSCFSLVYHLLLVSVACQELFNPITEDVSFKVSYRVQIFVGQDVDSMSEVYEYYQHNLAAANIWQLKFKYDDEIHSQTIKRFVYDGQRKVDIEILGHEENGPGELYLEENGGSSSYEQALDDDDFRNQPSFIKMNALDPKKRSLDSLLLYTEDSPDNRLDLDAFLLQHCLEKVQTKLSYIRGLTKLLHLIECRRDELSLDTATSGMSRSSRAESIKVYHAIKLKSMDGTESLDLTVTIEEKPPNLDGTKSQNSKTLPPKSLPLSLGITYNRPEQPRVSIIINLYRFDFVDLAEHMSESWSSKSAFLLPQAHNVVNLLPLADKISDSSTHHFKQFSFKALISSNNFAELEDSGLAELIVAYDGQTQMLARKMVFIDKTKSLITTYKRHSSRLVFDGKAKLKYHILDNLYEYQQNDELGQRIDTRDHSDFQSCASDTLMSYEAKMFDNRESSGADIFDLKNSVYLGMALVRGIPCKVYEKRIWRLPFWLGLGDSAAIQKLGAQLHLTLYESISKLVGDNFENEPAAKNHDDRSSKLVRLVISAVKPGLKDSTVGSANLMNLKLDLFSFHWSANLVNNDEQELFDIRQDCLFSNLNLRHVDLDLLFRTNNIDTKFALIMEEDDMLRNKVLFSSLEKVLGIGESQLVDLKSDFHRSSQNVNSSFHAKLTIFELPGYQILMDFICFAQDLTKKSYEFNNWLVGTSKVSLEECRWLSAHNLEYPSAAESDYLRTGNSPVKYFAYCPKTLHCLVGTNNDQWSVVRKNSFEIANVLKGPRESANKDDDSCSVYSIKLMGKKIAPTTIDTDGSTLVDWLVKKSHKLTGKTYELKMSDDDGANQLESTMRLVNVEISNLIDVRQRRERFDSVQGIGYQQPEGHENVLRGFTNLAQCAAICLLEHDCLSYSLCHEQSDLECTLTRANWTDSTKIKELRAIVSQGRKQNHLKSEMIITLDTGEEVRVNLKLSPLCSLHTMRHSNIFQLGNANYLIKIPELDTLLYSETIDECARFCIDRASFLVNELNTTLDRNSMPCSSFEFVTDLHLCALRPAMSLSKSLVAMNSSEETGREAAWLAASSRANANKDNKLMLFGDAQLYQLDHEQLFVAYSNERLTVIRDAEEDKQQWQLTYSGKTIAECARYCFDWLKCRSFDVRTTADNGLSSVTCTLNGLSYMDMSQANEKRLAKASKADKSETWWHYEPSELFFYLKGTIRQASRPSVIHSNDSSGTIFVDSSAWRANSGTGGRQERRTETDDTTDWSKAVESHDYGGLSLWFMATMTLGMLLGLPAALYIYRATRTTSGATENDAASRLGQQENSIVRNFAGGYSNINYNDRLLD